MELRSHCSSCHKNYVLDISNTTVYGPVIHTTCPFCSVKVKRNLAKFIEVQVGRGEHDNRFELVRIMCEFGRLLERKMTKGY